MSLLSPGYRNYLLEFEGRGSVYILGNLISRACDNYSHFTEEQIDFAMGPGSGAAG
jgi:hypothetical protein